MAVTFNVCGLIEQSHLEPRAYIKKPQRTAGAFLFLIAQTLKASPMAAVSLCSRT